jgi:hypothetical protein
MVTLVSTIASPFFFASAWLDGHEPLLRLSKEVTKKRRSISTATRTVRQHLS